MLSELEHHFSIAADVDGLKGQLFPSQELDRAFAMRASVDRVNDNLGLLHSRTIPNSQDRFALHGAVEYSHRVPRMAIPSNLVEQYRVLTREMQIHRRSKAPSIDGDAVYLKQLDELWRQMSREEQNAARAVHARSA